MVHVDLIMGDAAYVRRHPIRVEGCVCSYITINLQCHREISLILEPLTMASTGNWGAFAFVPVNSAH